MKILRNERLLKAIKLIETQLETQTGIATEIEIDLTLQSLSGNSSSICYH